MFLEETFNKLLLNCTVMLMSFIFIAISIAVSFLPFYIIFAITFIILIKALKLNEQSVYLALFMAIAVFSGLLTQSIIMIEPKVMLAMGGCYLAIFIFHYFTKISVLVSVYLLVFLTVSYFFVNFMNLAIPTALIAIMNGFATHLMCKKQKELHQKATEKRIEKNKNEKKGYY